jgi:glycosyltransferase involved in cell wall biosynthesis
VKLYNAANIFVLPTKIIREGQPNVIMESLSCGTPVITTDLPGPASVVTEGLGLLVPVGDEDRLYEAICKVLDGEFKIDQEKRAKFLNNYSIESVGQTLRTYFDEILSKN